MRGEKIISEFHEEKREFNCRLRAISVQSRANGVFFREANVSIRIANTACNF